MRLLSNAQIYRSGYPINLAVETETVKIPDWTAPIADPPEPEDHTFHEFGEKSSAEDAASEDIAQETEAVPEEPEEEPVPPPLTREEIEQQNQELLEQIKQEVIETACQAAYQDARTSKQKELEECVADVTEKFDELKKMHDDYVMRYTESLKYMAIEIAQKLMMCKIEEDDTALEALVKQTIGSIKHPEWISVDISNKLTHLVEKIQAELEQPEYEGNAEVHAGPYPIDTIRVNTESGTIDATISVQLENLREAFENAENSNG